MPVTNNNQSSIVQVFNNEYLISSSNVSNQIVEEVTQAFVIESVQGIQGPAGPNTITGLIEAGTNVSFTGSGTVSSPYIVSSSGGGGGVSSVGLSMPTEFAVSGSPVTSSGTLTVTKQNQNINLVYASPSSGSAGSPLFRSIVSADVPTLNQNTTGQSGTVATINGLISAGTNISLSGSGSSSSPYSISSANSEPGYQYTYGSSDSPSIGQLFIDTVAGNLIINHLDINSNNNGAIYGTWTSQLSNILIQKLGNSSIYYAIVVSSGTSVGSLWTFVYQSLIGPGGFSNGDSVVIIGSGQGLYNITSTTPTTLSGPLFGVNGYVNALIYSSSNLLAQTNALLSVLSVTSPNDSNKHSFKVGGYANIISIGTGSQGITFKVSFTDENGTSQTISMFPIGTTNSASSGTGFLCYPDITVGVNPNTSITLLTTLTNSHTISYDIGGVMIQII